MSRPVLGAEQDRRHSSKAAIGFDTSARARCQERKLKLCPSSAILVFLVYAPHEPYNTLLSFN